MTCTSLPRLLFSTANYFINEIYNLFPCNIASHLDTWEVGRTLEYRWETPRLRLSVSQRYSCSSNFARVQTRLYYTKTRYIFPKWRGRTALHSGLNRQKSLRFCPFNSISINKRSVDRFFALTWLNCVLFAGVVEGRTRTHLDSMTGAVCHWYPGITC